MSWNSKIAATAWMLLSALVSAALVGCGNESTPRIPAPPPFVPTSVVVPLGAEGGATTLISTQAGGWTHNSQDFTSGSTVRGENAATYRLTLSGGEWSAAFVSPDPARVRLGTSGDEVTLALQEDGSYHLGSSAVQSGHVVTAGNGNHYRLALSTSGEWSAEFVPAAPLRLALGISGDFVNIEMLENRSFWLDNSELRSGDVVRADNGSRYTLALGTDGMWRALFVPPDPQRVALGESGGTVLVTMLEQGTYQLDGGPLWSGEVRETAGGSKYRFVLGANGLWSATFAAEPETVRLGAHGGAIRVTQQENGGWTLGGEAIRSGHTVRGSNGHSYQLTLVDGAWRAMPQPMPIQVALQGTGGSIVLTQVEDGSYLYEGAPVSSGDVISVGSSSYLLTQAGSGAWQALRTVVPPGTPDPGEPLTYDALFTYVGVSPRVRLTQDGSASTREGSILELNGLEYSVGALFTHGRDHREITFAEEAHSLITEELEDIEVLIGLIDSNASLSANLEELWDRIAGHLDSLFPGEGSALLGYDPPKERDGTIDSEEVVEDIEDVLAALSTSSAFETALDDGIFSHSRQVDADDSDDTFYALRSATRLGFGWTTTTRYGAFSKQERSAISKTLDFASGSEGIGAFAYSPLEATRTHELPASGEAYYFGQTVAASRQSNQAIYSGDIELLVRFASRQVTALVTDLQDDQGSLWRYSLQEVDSIRLPAARLSASDASFEPVSSGTASVSFSPTSIRLSPRSLSADFEGRFVGHGADAGQSAIGTWSLVSSGEVILAGGFGAHSQATPIGPPPVDPPAHPTPDLGEVAETWLGTTRPDGSGDIRIEARDSDNDRIEVAASELSVNGGTIVVGEQLFDKARNVLQDNLALLDIYIDIFDSNTSQALQNRQTLWLSTNEALEDNIFGRANVLGANYPSGTRLSDRDEDAIELLQEAYQALGSAASFRDAVEDGGVFDGVLSQSRLDDGDYDFSEISAALEYEVEVDYDNTDYGRFGVWSKRVRANAVSPATVATGDERGDAFAYSQIGQTVYSPNDPNFPRGFSSSYVGRTLAVDTGSDGPTFYQGDISVAVGWNSNSPVGSRVTTVIENLARTDTGEPLLHDGYDVKDLIFGSATVGLDSQNRIGFSGLSSVRVRYFDLSRSERTYGAGSSEGKFVGYHPSGPLGVIGTWDLEGATIKGSFGADLAP